MSEPELAAQVRAAGLAAGLDAVGVAGAAPFHEERAVLHERRRRGLHGGMAFTYRNPDRSTDPGRTVPNARSLVVGARGYHRRGPSRPEPGTWGRVARYAWSDPYVPLRSALEETAGVLRRAGYRAQVVADDNALVDRAAAVRAGIGWYGKNANVLLPGRGSWFVLGSVITDADLCAAPEPVPDGCGSCSRCMTACPTGAIVAPGVVDARRCLAWLVQAPGMFPFEQRIALGDRLYGCDDCQEVCPPSRRSGGAAAPGAGDRAWVDVVAWIGLDDEELLRAAGHWYVPRREPRHLRRNALIVLANTAGTGDAASLRAALDAVAACLRSDDPLVRAHAVWAAARLGHPELADALASHETDPDVLEELRRRGEAGARPVDS